MKFFLPRPLKTFGILLSVGSYLTAQTPTAAAQTAAAPAPPDTVNARTTLKSSDVQFGIGLGYSISPQTTYSYYLSAPDHYLRRQTEAYALPVLSAIICYNPTYYYIKRGDEKLPLSQQRTKIDAGQYAWLAAVNLNDVFTSSLGFNQRISLGLGGGWRFGTGNHFYIGLFIEGMLRRFLRDNYDERIGNTLFAFPTSGATGIVTTLNLDDDTYFTTRPVFSAALKFVYTIGGGPPSLPVSNVNKE